ncbi:MAG TPA: S53 family peptidase [Candidatus Acidoferrales bacterium]|nr:S53 family peptidase [Candidatus Acidoferrales bacterium]
MRTRLTLFVSLLCVFAFLSLLPSPASAQTSTVRPRITQPVDDSRLTVLRGNTHPFARAEFDRGPAPATLPMERMLLVLNRSPEQEAALARLMAEQQDRSSPNFHKWLTPDEFGRQFGPADQDIQTVTRWLESHGFQVANISNGRTVIEFTGNAAQVEEAFHTPIHSFVVNGEQHWANASDPAIPSALTPVVAGVDTLHNFYPKPMSRIVSAASRSRSAKPQFTFVDNMGNTNYAVGPTDFATIYNVLPLWKVGTDGTGVTIAIVTDSNINVQDVADFRSIFGLPPNAPTVTVNGTDPGRLPNMDEPEAILDVEWSGAVAKNATINLVVSKSTSSTFGGDLSATFIVNEATPPPVLSESFGACELALGTSGNMFYNNTWQQAASEGITVLVSTGDNGSAGCDVTAPATPASCGISANATVQVAHCGLQVSGIASTPFNVAVGGTDFNEPNPTLFWNPSNGNTPLTFASALGYVPEMAYNDSCTNPVVFTFFGFGGSTPAVDACSNSTVQSQNLVSVVGGSGGVSSCTTFDGTNPSSCTGGYAKPAFQASLTPGDGKRDIPDVSVFSGDGTISPSFYIICERDFPGGTNAACSLSSGVFLTAGGTSVSAQAFAGIMALVVQKNASSQGNANVNLYNLAATPANVCASAPNPAATCVFYDTTVGTIAMPCAPNSLNCSLTAAGVPGGPLALNWRTLTRGPAIAGVLCLVLLLLGFLGRSRRWNPAMALLACSLLIVGVACGGGNGGTSGGPGVSVGVLTGFNAGSGFDFATGLGTVNAANLVAAPGWAAVPSVPNLRTPALLARTTAAASAPLPARTPASAALNPAFQTPDRNAWAVPRILTITFALCFVILLLGFRGRPRGGHTPLTL